MPDILIPDTSLTGDEIKEIARYFASIYPTHPTDFGMLSGWKKDDNGNPVIGAKNNYTQTRKAKYSDYKFHLTARQDEPRGIGMYPIDLDGLVSFIMVDIDEKSQRADECVASLCSLVKSCGGYPYIERSVQGRWHFWFLPTEKMDMGVARRISAVLKARAESFKVPVEMYPATYPTAKPERRVGKYVNLPYRGALSQSEYSGTGVTYLINPYVDDRVSFMDEDYEAEEDQEIDYGDAILVYDLKDIKLNNLDIQLEMAELGGLVIANTIQKENRIKATMQTRNGPANMVSFEKVIDALKKNEPRKGNHHFCLLAIAGIARRNGISKEVAFDKIMSVIPHWRQERGRNYSEEVKRSLDSTYSKPEGSPITGFDTLRRLGII